MELSEKLINARKEKGLTQSDVADALDISRQAISRWEVGVAAPSMENLKRLSELYDISTDYLLSECVEQAAPSGTAEEHLTKLQGRKSEARKYGIIFVCIACILIAVTALIYRSVPHDGPDTLSFDEMESDAWNTENTDEFSLSW